MSSWERSLRAVLAFIYPPACPGCGRGAVETSGFCGDCQRGLLSELTDVCRRCGAPVGPHLDTQSGCIHCRQDRFAFEAVYSLGVYSGPLRRACLQGQRQSSGRMLRALADLWCDRWAAPVSDLRCEVIVPVPSHWSTRLRAAPPAAQTLAEQCARRLRLPCDPSIVRKVRRTAAQASLPPTLRRQNLRGAFRLARGVRLDAPRILLVDDVLTTGATAHGVATVLRSGGAAQVYVAVLARGIGT